MIPYILVALFPPAVGYVYNEHLMKNKKNKAGWRRWLALLVAALPMFLLIGFRGETIGADTYNYLNNFTIIDNTDWRYIFDITRMESGYILFIKVIGIFTDSALVYQVVCALIYLLAVTTFANQLEKANFAFLYFFATMGIYTFMFTGTRQCLAISICLFSYTFIKKRQVIPVAAFIVLAYFFHKSSILFIAAYLIYSIPLGIISALIYAVLGVLAYFNIGIIQEWFNDQLDYSYGIEETGSGYIFLAITIIVTVFSIVMICNYKRLTKHAQGLINVSFIALVFWFLRIATRVAERPSYYFLFFTMAMLAYALNAIKERDHKIVLSSIVGAMAMALYIYRFMTNFSTFVPYYFY